MNESGGAITFHLPPALRELVQGQQTVQVRAGSVGQAVSALSAAHPLVGVRLVDTRGELRRHVNLFLGEQNVRDLQGLNTPVTPGDTIFVIPAVAGG